MYNLAQNVSNVANVSLGVNVTFVLPDNFYLFGRKMLLTGVNFGRIAVYSTEFQATNRTYREASDLKQHLEFKEHLTARNIFN
jgi:hypothetical protein